MQGTRSAGNQIRQDRKEAEEQRRYENELALKRNQDDRAERRLGSDLSTAELNRDITGFKLGELKKDAPVKANERALKQAELEGSLIISQLKTGALKGLTEDEQGMVTETVVNTIKAQGDKAYRETLNKTGKEIFDMGLDDVLTDDEVLELSLIKMIGQQAGPSKTGSGSSSSGVKAQTDAVALIDDSYKLIASAKEVTMDPEATDAEKAAARKDMENIRRVIKSVTPAALSGKGVTPQQTSYMAQFATNLTKRLASEKLAKQAANAVRERKQRQKELEAKFEADRGALVVEQGGDPGSMRAIDGRTLTVSPSEQIVTDPQDVQRMLSGEILGNKNNRRPSSGKKLQVEVVK